MKAPQRALFSPAAVNEAVDLQQVAAEAEANTSRRRSLLRWLGWGSLGALLSQTLGGTMFGFLSSQRTVVSTPSIDAAGVDDLVIGEVKLFPVGKFYLARVPEGFLALWTRCPHLGCTVPWRPDEPVGTSLGIDDTSFATEGRFHCPCHLSVYNRYGEVVSGPTPRPMDRFPVTVRDGRVLVQAGSRNAIQRARALASEATPAQA